MFVDLLYVCLVIMIKYTPLQPLLPLGTEAELRNSGFSDGCTNRNASGHLAMLWSYCEHTYYTCQSLMACGTASILEEIFAPRLHAKIINICIYNINLIRLIAHIEINKYFHLKVTIVNVVYVG